MKKAQTPSKTAVARAVAEFNKYRSPEATAILVSKGSGNIVVEFTGHFCRTCGFYDYFDDFVITLEESGVKAKRLEVKEFDGGARVNFGIKAAKRIKIRKANS